MSVERAEQIADHERVLIDLRREVASGGRLSVHQTAQILGLLRSIEVMLIARQVRDALAPVPSIVAAMEAPDAWLTADEVAARLKHTRAWVYRQARRWPFAKRPSRKSLLISERGLTRWMERR